MTAKKLSIIFSSGRRMNNTRLNKIASLLIRSGESLETGNKSVAEGIYDALVRLDQNPYLLYGNDARYRVGVPYLG